MERLKESNSIWFTPTGSHVAYRLSQADMLACVKMVHGSTRQIWLDADPKGESIERQRDELVVAYQEIERVLAEIGLEASPR